MAELPQEYQWIDAIEDKPRLISEALALYGVTESAGAKDNPVILAWAHEVGGDVEAAYLHDATPWCGLFMAVVAMRADKTPPVNPLWALNWKNFGQSAGQASFGDVLVFTRQGGGHVGLYVAEDKGAADRGPAYHVLGGNTADTVTIRPILKARLYAARRPIWQVAQPRSVKPIVVAATGALSSNES